MQRLEDGMRHPTLFLFLQEIEGGKKHGWDTFRNMSLAIVTPVQESMPNSWFEDTGLEARKVVLFFWIFMGNVLSMAYRYAMLALSKNV